MRVGRIILCGLLIVSTMTMTAGCMGANNSKSKVKVVPSTGKTVEQNESSSMVAGVSMGEGQYDSIEELFMSSDAVFVGTVADVPSGRFASEPGAYSDTVNIVTDVVINVSKYYRNKLDAGELIKITLLGGAAKLPPEALQKKGYGSNDEITRHMEGHDAQFYESERVLVFARKDTFAFMKANGKEAPVDRLAVTGGPIGKFGVLPLDGDRWQGVGAFDIKSDDLDMLATQ